MTNPQTSVIIRTKNEGPIFKEVLETLKNQTDQDFEIVQVDDNSSDGTEKLALEYFPKAKIINVPPGKFSHSFSSNLGCQNSSGKYLVFLNGHAIPISKTWLEDGLKDFEISDKVVGVYGSWRAHKSSTIWDKIMINGWFNAEFFLKGKEVLVREKFYHGLLQTTNAIILKEFWEKRHFDEKRGMGGEDTDWAMHWIKQGYSLVLDRKFSVYHSHNLSPRGWAKELKFWSSLSKPTPFNSEDYRKKRN